MQDINEIPGFSWNPPDPDNAPTRQVLFYALRCALAWEGEARIMGNLRAADLQRALVDVLNGKNIGLDISNIQPKIEGNHC